MLEPVGLRVFYLANMHPGELVVFQNALRHKGRNHSSRALTHTHTPAETQSEARAGTLSDSHKGFPTLSGNIPKACHNSQGTDTPCIHLANLFIPAPVSSALPSQQKVQPCRSKITCDMGPDYLYWRKSQTNSLRACESARWSDN